MNIRHIINLGYLGKAALPAFALALKWAVSVLKSDHIKGLTYDWLCLEYFTVIPLFLFFYSTLREVV